MVKRRMRRVLCAWQGASRTILFCNKIETCRKVENLLKRKGDVANEEDLVVLPYHAAIEDGVRSKALKVWLTRPRLSNSAK